jgi:hypothetical protein
MHRGGTRNLASVEELEREPQWLRKTQLHAERWGMSAEKRTMQRNTASILNAVELAL